MKTIYAGTYTTKQSQGIYTFTFEDGKLENKQLFATIQNPKYITKQEEIVFVVADFKDGSGVASYNTNGEIIDTITYETKTSCFITVEKQDIYTANYHTGTITHLTHTNGKLTYKNAYQIQEGAGSHQVLLYKEYVLVPCLFLDQVIILDRDLNKVNTIQFPKNTGPRHGVFTKDKQYLYLVSELSNELFVIQTKDWKILHQISVLDNGETHVKDTAAIRLSNDEKHIYVSTRTKDVLSCIQVENHVPTFIQTQHCQGKHPRDFILIDNYLICGNRDTNDVICFRINEDGTIGDCTSKIEIPEVVALTY